MVYDINSRQGITIISSSIARRVPKAYIHSQSGQVKSRRIVNSDPRRVLFHLSMAAKDSDPILDSIYRESRSRLVGITCLS